MIKFNLVCDAEHEFEIWFSSNEDFERQQSKHLITCPYCSSANVSKTLMSPAVMGTNEKQKKIIEQMRELRKELLSDAKDVGDKFPEEARKIHYGESDAQSIYGNATSDEIDELLDEGIEVSRLPNLPEDSN